MAWWLWVIVVIAVLVLLLFFAALPDLRRYLKMRAM
jgi:hypothetical protein